MRPQPKRPVTYLGSLPVKVCLLLTVSLLTVFAGKAVAQEIGADSFNAIGTIWLITAASLVFFMNAGFAMLEAGFCRTGNAINVLAKNLIAFCISAFAFWFFGFRFMFGDSAHAIVGQIGLLVEFPFPSAELLNPFPEGFERLASQWPGRSFAALFFFQLVFAGTAATIVSGAIAERVKFWAFVLFSFVLVGFIYPLTGYWIWGGGWLAEAPIQFRDFAGATVVHTVGGIAALVGAIILGPRQGRFGYSAASNGFTETPVANRFEPHNLSLATLGCFILWLGWLGFNGGSTARLEYVPHIIITTTFAAAGGGVGAILFSPSATNQKTRLSSIINGILGGLVGITSVSAYVGGGIAIIVGFTSGLLILWADKALKYWKIDDPVGAIPVHFVCGGWSALSVGLFASGSSVEYQLSNYHRLTQVLYQILGWLTVSTVAAVLSLLAWASIGILLYAMKPSSDKISKQQLEKMQKNYPAEQNKISLLSYLLFISRQGLRVPLMMEEQGGTPEIIP